MDRHVQCVLCFAVSPEDHAYHEAPPRGTRFIYAHTAQSWHKRRM